MRINKQTQNERPCLALETIMTATQGNSESLVRLLKHFLPYITTLAKVDLYDAVGNEYHFIDEDIRHQLEIKLIIAATQFKIA